MYDSHETGTEKSDTLMIGPTPVGAGQPCLVVAEVGMAHDGSLGAAHAYVDAVAKTAAGAIKFQTHIAQAESTPSEPFRVKFSHQDATRFDYWQRTAFTETQWHGLAEHARQRGLIFLSSPFSIEAVNLLESMRVPAWKVAAGEIGSLPMLRAMARTGKPVLLSSGMCSWDHLDAAVACVREENAPLAVFQCTTAYPCPPEKLGLNLIAEMRRRYRCPVGLSDHSGVIFSALAAATLGADLIEVHVTFSPDCFGPDVSSSLTIAELVQLVEGIRHIETALNCPIDKNQLAEEMAPLRRTFMKSVVAARDLAAGHRITEEDLATKKPGSGIPASRLHAVVGRILAEDVSVDTLIGEKHLA